jgi:hypothetical protein
MRIIDDILKEFLFTGSKLETRFIVDFLSKYQKPASPEPAPSNEKEGLKETLLAAVRRLLSLYQEPPQEEEPEESGQEDAVKIDQQAFDRIYTAIKGLYLFWIDFTVFNMLKHTKKPNAFRDEISKSIRLYCDKHRSKGVIVGQITRQYETYARYFIANAKMTGKLDPKAALETAAFYETLSGQDLGLRDEYLTQREDTQDFFNNRRDFIMMWLGNLETRIKGDVVITKRRQTADRLKPPARRR